MTKNILVIYILLDLFFGHFFYNKGVISIIVKKRLNNNVVVSEENGQSIILIGNGLGFQVYPGDRIDTVKIEKKYYSSDSFELENIMQTYGNASKEDIALIDKIVQMGEKVLGKQVNLNIRFTLLDHLLSVLLRYEKNKVLESPITWEIQSVYPNEAKIGRNAVELINSCKKIQLPMSEGTFIALHFINAQFVQETLLDTMEFSELIGKINQIVKYQLQIELNHDSISFRRFVVHLRYYLMRQKNQETLDTGNEDLYFVIKEKFPQESECVNKITQFIYQFYGWDTNNDEKLYLILHLNRVLHT